MESSCWEEVFPRKCLGPTVPKGYKGNYGGRTTRILLAKIRRREAPVKRAGL